MNRWTVLVVTRERTWPVELSPHRACVLGRGRGATIEVAGEGVAVRHLSLRVGEAGVQLEVLEGALPVLVNDVPVPVSGHLRSGDELRLGPTRLVLLGAPAPAPARLRLAPFDEVMSRLEDEVRRASPGEVVGVAAVAPLSLNVVARGALGRRLVDEVARQGVPATWGELAPDVLVCVASAARPALLGPLLAALPVVAGPRAKVAVADTAEVGPDPEGLVGALWTRLLGAEVDAAEPVVEDPVLVRLWGLMGELASGGGRVCAVGPPGSGRRTLLRRLVEVAGWPWVEVDGADATAVEAALGREGPVVLRGVERTPPALLRAPATARVLATAAEVAPGFEAVVLVPPLAARPLDVPVMAEAFLAHARQALDRPRLHLGPEALALLKAWPWPGNVRELKNVVFRAARAAVRDEVGRDSLPVAITGAAPAESLKGAMRAAEREILLEALARTRWNVSAAATRLGMPRRTVVYRMARLGLRRPAR
jgi:Bacterial regulatory protein, Fis family